MYKLVNINSLCECHINIFITITNFIFDKVHLEIIVKIYYLNLKRVEKDSFCINLYKSLIVIYLFLMPNILFYKISTYK